MISPRKQRISPEFQAPNVLARPAAFLAFNKKIADEIGAKLVKVGGSGVRSGTFHSFAFQTWRGAAPSVRVDGKKMEMLMEQHNLPKNLRSFVGVLVSLAKQNGFGLPDRPGPHETWAYIDLADHHDLEDKLYSGFSEPTLRELEMLKETGIEQAQRFLKLSIELNEQTIDFDDMIYAPLYHHARFWENDTVLIDEAQDTNPVRRIMAERMLKPGGRLIAVGDPRQAIYGFTGADHGALDLIQERFDCTLLPLTVTYRCPKAVVRLAQRWVSHIQAHESAPEGIVRTIDERTFKETVPDKSDAILCRNTKPLVELAFNFIKRRIACHVEGRDIGNGLIVLAKRWKSVQTVEELSVRLEDYWRSESLRLISSGKDEKVAALQDKIDTLRIFMDALSADSSIYDLVRSIESLFQDTDGAEAETITLSTIHKAKGREWDTVYLYGRNKFMPSPFAQQPWQIGQEHNLIYVAVTRAKKELVEVYVA